MELPVPLTVEPMLAKSVATLPVQPGMAYEPKWDGFRCLIFRDDDRGELISRGSSLSAATGMRASAPPFRAG